MSTSAPPHRPCEHLSIEGLDGESIHRFVLGTDEQPRKLTAAEAHAELGDPFATLLLLRGTFPRTAGDVLEGLAAAVTADDPLRVQRFFLVGEGSQIPPGPGVPAVKRQIRFLATCGRGPDGPDVFVSAFDPDHDTVELMAWDRVRSGFNFYRTVGQSTAWVFAGNSGHALTTPTRGNGPFESHVAGHFLMKELRFPWLHWDSPAARVQPETVGELRDHPWFLRRDPGGAYALEEEVALPSIRRWTRARLTELVTGGGRFEPAKRLVDQVLTTHTVNLITSATSSRAAIAGAVDVVDLPQTFFVDTAALVELLGLGAPPQPLVASSIYAQALETFDSTLTDGGEFAVRGDTHFAFAVPERAAEDTEALAQALGHGVLTRRLAACLLMVDFPNPIFSARRTQLLDHVPDDATAGTLAERTVAAILTSPDAAQAGTPEREFADRWNVGEAFEDAFNALLRDYYAAFMALLRTQEGFDDYLRLAESRRQRVRAMPIAESEMLFATTNIADAEREMRPDGTIA